MKKKTFEKNKTSEKKKRQKKETLSRQPSTPKKKTSKKKTLCEKTDWKNKHFFKKKPIEIQNLEKISKNCFEKETTPVEKLILGKNLEKNLFEKNNLSEKNFEKRNKTHFFVKNS